MRMSGGPKGPPFLFASRCAKFAARHTPRKRGIQYAAAYRFNHWLLWITGSPAFAGDDDCDRHCEHSEAIHSFFMPRHGLLRCARNDVDIVSQSRSALRPRFAGELPVLLFRGRREDRVLAAPAVSRAICANKSAHEHTGQREHSGLPCAMALRLIASSPR
jgi:hypothetical protein